MGKLPAHIPELPYVTYFDLGRLSNDKDPSKLVNFIDELRRAAYKDGWRAAMEHRDSAGTDRT